MTEWNYHRHEGTQTLQLTEANGEASKRQRLNSTTEIILTDDSECHTLPPYHARACYVSVVEEGHLIASMLTYFLRITKKKLGETYGYIESFDQHSQDLHDYSCKILDAMLGPDELDDGPAIYVHAWEISPDYADKDKAALLTLTALDTLARDWANERPIAFMFDRASEIEPAKVGLQSIQPIIDSEYWEGTDAQLQVWQRYTVQEPMRAYHTYPKRLY